MELEQLRKLRHCTPQTVLEAIKNERVAKTALSLLYNICLDRSIVLSSHLKQEFQKFESLILRLLEGVSPDLNKTSGIEEKYFLLKRNPGFVKVLSLACPCDEQLC